MAISELNRMAAIDATIREWQMAGDTRNDEDIYPEAECYVDAYEAAFNEAVENAMNEARDTAEAEAKDYAIAAANEALEEFKKD